MDRITYLFIDPAAPAAAMSVLKLPADEEGRRELTRRVNRYLDLTFAARLSKPDLAMWRAGESEKWSDAEKKRIWATIDYSIIDRAQTLGWRIFESIWVRTRIQQWHDGHRGGVERLRKLFRAIELSARAARGQARRPIAMRDRDEWRTAKKLAVSELRLLLRQQKNEFNQRRRRPAENEIQNWLRSTIEKSPQSFKFLSFNLESFVRYLDWLKQNEGAQYGCIMLGEVRPAALFDAWAAWGQNLNPESLRQAISKKL